MDAVRKAIEANNQKFMEVFKRGDAAGVAMLYTEDARLLPPDSKMTSGRAAIESFWRGAMSMGIKEAKLETIEVESRDDLAYEVGKFVLTIQPDSGESTSVAGKYVVVWRNQADAWKLHVDIWNAGA